MATADSSVTQVMHSHRRQRPEGSTALQLSGVPLILAHVFCTVLAITVIWIIISGNVSAIINSDGSWLNAFFDSDQVQQAADDWRIMATLLALVVLFIMRFAVLLACAALIVRRSSELIAFVVAVFLISAAGADFPPNYFSIIQSQPTRAIVGLSIDICFMVTAVALFYVFPDGRFVPWWTIVPTVLWLGVLVWTFFVVQSLDGQNVIVGMTPPFILITTTIGAQLHRYRRMASVIERQQIKWFVGSLGIFLITFVIGNAVLGFVGGFDEEAYGSVVQLSWLSFEIVSTVAALCVPIGLAVAVLKFRLFAIDIILNRALIYGGLSVAVVGLYAGVVAYLGRLFRSDDNLVISLVATTVVALAFQPIRERLQRGANRLLYGNRDDPYAVFVRLGQRLEDTLAPETVLPTIAETVREALRLPYAAVALDRDGELITVTESGTPGPIAVNLPLVYQHERVGALLLVPRLASDSFDAADLRLLTDLAHQAGVAVHAVRLTDELQRARERLVATREEERRRLRRDLHDGLGPTLGGLILKLDVAESLIDYDPARARALVQDLRGQVQAATTEIRRLVYLLRPPALDDLGLAGALRIELARYEPGTLTISMIMPDQLPTLPASIEVATFRIVQEAVTNVVRHANASHCTVRIGLNAAALDLEVTDNGCGLPAETTCSGVGMLSMRERATELGGTCHIVSMGGRGTRVSARLPFTCDP